jgi:hypothetical protein
MSLSYHHLGLVDVSIHAIMVHRLLAQLVLLVPLWHDSKVLGRPPAVESVLGLRILNQPIDRPLKMLVLGQIDLFRLCGLHLLLQPLRVVCGNRYAAGVLEGALDHLSCRATLLNLELTMASLTPSDKRKYSYMQKRIKFTCQSKKKTIKIWKLYTEFTENIFTTTSWKEPWLAYCLSIQWVHERAASRQPPTGTMLGYNNWQKVPIFVLTQLRCP